MFKESGRRILTSIKDKFETAMIVFFFFFFFLIYGNWDQALFYIFARSSFNLLFNYDRRPRLSEHNWLLLTGSCLELFMYCFFFSLSCIFLGRRLANNGFLVMSDSPFHHLAHVLEWLFISYYTYLPFLDLRIMSISQYQSNQSLLSTILLSFECRNRKSYSGGYPP